MAGVSPLLFDAMESGGALMEVMRETAVSLWFILTVSTPVAISEHWLLQFVQFPVKVEHFDAAMVSVSSPLAAVMGVKIVLMAVTKLDVVSKLFIITFHIGRLFNNVVINITKFVMIHSSNCKNGIQVYIDHNVQSVCMNDCFYLFYVLSHSFFLPLVDFQNHQLSKYVHFLVTLAYSLKCVLYL